jgi:sterol desaturase/sphingolipid hydroxylase (fatty acid hydroxylase superfamily)
MPYWQWLVVASLVFALAERLRPARPRQRIGRPQLANDLFYNAFNGYFWALLTGGVATALSSWIRGNLEPVVPFPAVNQGLARLPWLAQCASILVVSDLLQWCVHNLLHRVPFLWWFHKVHHSAHRMDWSVNFRFHWMELVVYRSLLYVPLALLGGAPTAIFAVVVFATFWGHFNHANVDVDLGSLGRIFNGPRMHLWHHDASAEGGVAKNFGVVLSVWDFLFGTAYWPRDRVPERLGYPGDEEMPRDLSRQMIFPLLRSARGAPASS